jgi:hypothetical protein
MDRATGMFGFSHKRLPVDVKKTVAHIVSRFLENRCPPRKPIEDIGAI